jgi:hypothetical protein
MVIIQRSTIPRFFEIFLAKGSKRSVQIVIVGLPPFSNSTESWILHDVQEPQSPIAFITRSQEFIKSPIILTPAEAARVCF